MGAALKVFAVTADQQIIFSESLVRSLRSAALVGDYSVSAGLLRLLAGSGLVVDRTPSGVFMLRQEPRRGPASGPPHVGAEMRPSPSVRRPDIEPTPQLQLRPNARAPAAPRPSGDESDELLGEVVVTATKQADTISRVPLSVTAVTQKSIEQQGIKNVEDLFRTIPSVTFRRGQDNSPAVSIRGIASSTGAATTGVYLDDTPIQKRNVIGISSGNGTPFPQLFDLERVEVLRGPQGTLYGGSSEGGTIRFITPAPSLDTYSAYLRGEGSATKDGDPSGEAGLAVGGPILQDKLGFRASVWARHTGGYIDHVSRFDGRVIDPDTNSQEAHALRLAVLFAPTDRLRITPAVYSSYEHLGDVDSFWESIPQYTTPAMRYNSAGQAINAAGTNGPVAYTHPAYTYGPFAFGPYKSGLNSDIGENYRNQIPEQARKTPRTSRLLLPSLTLEYDFEHMAVKSITSYIEDQTKGLNDYTYSEPLTFTGSQFVFDLPEYAASFHYINKRRGLTEELRFASSGQDSPLTWVAGLFYSNSNMHTFAYNTWTTDSLLPVARGISDVQNYGAPLLPGRISSVRDQVLNENELAAFGEANYLLTQKLKLTAGVRLSRTRLGYFHSYYGQAAGYLVPSVANGGVTQDVKTESPVTPKVGLSYQLNEADMVYVNAAKGFRIGGVNPPVSVAKCRDDLAALGQTTTPPTFDSDSVWSYEAGAKLRLFGNRAQINSSLFYIDWKNVQINAALPTCGFSYITNGGAAISKGANVESQIFLRRGSTLIVQLDYTDAYYKELLQSPAVYTPNILVNAGDSLGTPRWRYTVGLKQDFRMAGRFRAYVRADYQYVGAYDRGVGPGAQNFQPDVFRVGSTRYVSARLGVGEPSWELALFVTNLFDSQDLISQTGGRSGCSNTACTSYRQYNPIFTDVTFRPRTVGLSFSYKY